jgi:hypothetical protein
VNGTRPTAASLLYKGPIALFASAPIRAIAVLSGWVNSNVAIAAYKVVGPPQAKTGAAAKVTASTAALTGTANDLGAAAQAWFVWGTSSTSLTSTSGSINLAASNSSQAVNITIQGLAANTKYYFQEVVTTVGGTSKGAIVSFTTP